MRPRPSSHSRLQLREPGLEVDRELEAHDAERPGAAAGDRHRCVRRARRARHDEFEQAAPPNAPRPSKSPQDCVLCKDFAPQTADFGPRARAVKRPNATCPKVQIALTVVARPPNLSPATAGPDVRLLRSRRSASSGQGSTVGHCLVAPRALSSPIWCSLSSHPDRHSPQQRLERLCDPGSVEPLGARPRRPPVPEVGVVAAWGRVAGRPIVCYAQDSADLRGLGGRRRGRGDRAGAAAQPRGADPAGRASSSPGGRGCRRAPRRWADSGGSSSRTWRFPGARRRSR